MRPWQFVDSAEGWLWLARTLAAKGSMRIAASTSVWSATVPSFNTGVDNDGSLVALGAADPHWEVVAGPGITSPQAAVVLNARNPLGTYYTTTDSEWIWVTARGVAGTNSPYTFQPSFDLDGYNPATTVITGKWGVDNVGAMDINGVAAIGSGDLALTDPSNFLSPNPFTVAGPFHAKCNCTQAYEMKSRSVNRPGFR